MVYISIFIAVIIYVTILNIITPGTSGFWGGMVISLMILFVPMILIDRRSIKKKETSHRFETIKKGTHEIKDEKIKNQIESAKNHIIKAAAAYKEVKISKLS